MAVMKVIEVMANSSESWEDATRKAVKACFKKRKAYQISLRSISKCCCRRMMMLKSSV